MDRFEQLQILKHAWKGQIVDTASFNLSKTEDIVAQKTIPMFGHFEKIDLP